ncbi:hypothetical protein SO802_002395 [Lithocarpus litseifolius]|uniref:RNase H type-1 domain-containing protein n=1 Tax=Lithocarpus litseifolius TaxID=425828 RepID=A0AAW2DY19_9ROSI
MKLNNGRRRPDRNRFELGLVIVLLSQRISLPFTVIEVETLAVRRALEMAMEMDLIKLSQKEILRSS